MGSRFRAWLWPQRGWKRAWTYIVRRVVRLADSPHKIALGFAAGAFASFTPFVGFHFIIGFAAAGIVGGNILASAFGTFVGNPLTFPLIWWSTYEFGKKLLGLSDAGAAKLNMPNLSMWTMLTDPVRMWQQFADRILPIVKPMMAGGLPLGLLCAVAGYVVVRWSVSAYQQARRTHLANRRKENGATALEAIKNKLTAGKDAAKPGGKRRAKTPRRGGGKPPATGGGAPA